MARKTEHRIGLCWDCEVWDLLRYDSVIHEWVCVDKETCVYRFQNYCRLGFENFS